MPFNLSGATRMPGTYHFLSVAVESPVVTSSTMLPRTFFHPAISGRGCTLPLANLQLLGQALYFLSKNAVFAIFQAERLGAPLSQSEPA